MVALSRGRFDTVIVDTAPTGHTLRLLAAPALLGRVAGVLDTLQSHHRAVVSALRGSYRADAADSLIAELEREGEALAAMLRDPAASEITWVTLPEPMALEETVGRAGIARRRRHPRPPADRESRDGAAAAAVRVVRRARARFEARALAPVARALRRTARSLALPELPRRAARRRGAARGARRAAAVRGSRAPSRCIRRLEHPGSRLRQHGGSRR